MAPYRTALAADISRLRTRSAPSASRCPKSASTTRHTTSRNMPAATAQTSARAERLPRQLVHRPGGAGVLLGVPEGELHREPAEQQVDDAIGDQPDPRDDVEGVAALGTTAELVGVVGCLLGRVAHDCVDTPAGAHWNTSSLNHDSVT